MKHLMTNSLTFPLKGNNFILYEKCYIKKMIQNDKLKQDSSYLKEKSSIYSLANLIIVVICQLNINRKNFFATCIKNS